jgi:hypothetical protein
MSTWRYIPESCLLHARRREPEISCLFVCFNIRETKTDENSNETVIKKRRKHAGILKRQLHSPGSLLPRKESRVPIKEEAERGQ